MSACYHVNMSICQHVNMSTCNHVILRSCPLSTCGISLHVLNPCQCVIMSAYHVNMLTYQYVNMLICQHANKPTCQHVNMSTCPHVHMSTCQHVHMSTCQLLATVCNFWHLLATDGILCATFFSSIFIMSACNFVICQFVSL